MAYSIIIIIAISLISYYLLSSKSRKRKKILSEAFPENWRKILLKEIAYFHTLSAEDKEKFEKAIQLFIGEKRITAIKTTIDDRIRILVAASAIIPVFGYKDWEYSQLAEVLIFPDALESSPEGGFTLGQVSVMLNTNVMALSKSALEQGFKNLRDKTNVGIHEFAHIIDQADGSVDGIPALFLPKQYHKIWKLIVDVEIKKIRQGSSEINPYGATNETEFFAVATEYFFEQPGLLEKNHPDLYNLLVKVYKQNTGKSFKGKINKVFNSNRKTGRNSPCPCGSGKKFKHCCLGE